MKMLAVAMLFLLATVLPAAAQPGGTPAAQTSAQQAVPTATAAGTARREKLKQRIRALRAYTLTEQLDLDEATAAKLFPALAKYDEELDKLLQTRADVQRRLAAAGGIKGAGDVDKLIDEAMANQRALWNTEDNRVQQLRKILTPAQTARLLVVLPALERKLQDHLRRASLPPAKAPPRAAEQTEVMDPFARRPKGGSGDGELADNPFDRRPAGQRPSPKPAPKAAPKSEDAVMGMPNKQCDPFSDKHGCRK